LRGTNVRFGPRHQKSRKNTGFLQDLTLKKLGVLAIEVAIITLFVASLWWAADKNKAFG